MRYRAEERFTKVWRVIDTQRIESGGSSWPFHQPSTIFYDQHSAEQLAGILNAIAELAGRIEWRDGIDRPNYCAYCHAWESYGHAEGGPWLVLKGAL